MKKLRFNEKIYTYQIDFVGHVNNIVYVQWLENARVRLTEAMGLSIADLAKKEGILPIITETHIEYKIPFFLSDTLTIEVWIGCLRNASADFRFHFTNQKGELCSVAWQKVLFIDRATQRPSRKIAAYRENFERFLVEEDELLPTSPKV